MLIYNRDAYDNLTEETIIAAHGPAGRVHEAVKPGLLAALQPRCPSSPPAAVSVPPLETEKSDSYLWFVGGAGNTLS